MPLASRRLLLITASSPEIRRVRRSRVLNFQQVTMPYLAAYAPSHWTVLHVDEVVESVDLEASVDLVAITFHTPSAPHAYEIAARFRQRGVVVALGGPHVTLLPDEAQAHADVIFIGEAEHTWPRFLAELEAGKHQERYSSEPPALDKAPISRQDLFHRRDHAAGVLFATRGCVHRCDFCTLAVMYQSQVRKRPVEAVAREYASFRGKVVILWDDDIAGDIEYAKALFHALTPHRKWWSSQASIHAAGDKRLDAEGRILTRDWRKYNGRVDVVFQPRHMSPQAFLAGYRYANRRFYSWASAYKRLSRSPVQFSWTLPLNLAYALALRYCQ